MTQIKKILESLSDSERKALMVAFESNISYSVTLSNGKYIGVNMQGTNKEIEEGAWSYGTRK